MPRAVKMCVKCNLHGLSVVLAGHSLLCPYKQCECEGCQNHDKALAIQRQERRLRNIMGKKRGNLVKQEIVVDNLVKQETDPDNSVNQEREELWEDESNREEWSGGQYFHLCSTVEEIDEHGQDSEDSDDAPLASTPKGKNEVTAPSSLKWSSPRNVCSSFSSLQDAPSKASSDEATSRSDFGYPYTDSFAGTRYQTYQITGQLPRFSWSDSDDDTDLEIDKHDSGGKFAEDSGFVTNSNGSVGNISIKKATKVSWLKLQRHVELINDSCSDLESVTELLDGSTDDCSEYFEDETDIKKQKMEQEKTGETVSYRPYCNLLEENCVDIGIKADDGDDLTLNIKIQDGEIERSPEEDANEKILEIEHAKVTDAGLETTKTDNIKDRCSIGIKREHGDNSTQNIKTQDGEVERFHEEDASEKNLETEHPKVTDPGLEASKTSNIKDRCSGSAPSKLENVTSYSGDLLKLKVLEKAKAIEETLAAAEPIKRNVWAYESNDSKNKNSENNNLKKRVVKWDVPPSRKRYRLPPAPPLCHVAHLPIPQHLRGLVIGRHGHFMHKISWETGVLVTFGPVFCTIQGTCSGVDRATRIIEDKLKSWNIWRYSPFL